jgi:hypothetical protein
MIKLVITDQNGKGRVLSVTGLAMSTDNTLLYILPTGEQVRLERSSFRNIVAMHEDTIAAAKRL